MKISNKYKLVLSIVVTITSMAFVSTTQGQSTDIDNPTILTSNVIDGEGDGKAETFYYSFTAMKGDVKVTVDAKTDYYSVILAVALLDEDGKELLNIQNVATDTGKREVVTKHFVHDQKVIVRIALPKDDHLKLLNYKIKLDGSMKVEVPVVPVEVAPVVESAPAVPSEAAPLLATEPATADPAAAPTVSDPAESQTPAATETTKKSSTKNKIKEKIKKEVKKAVKDNVPD